MGSKIEYIVALLAIIIVLFAKYVHIKPINADTQVATSKSIEFKDFTAYDINQTNINSIIKGSNAIKYSDKWVLKNPDITTKDIKRLTSKDANYTDKFLIFKNSVVAIKTDGTIYKSNYAKYNLKTDELFTPNKFQIAKKSDKVVGKELYYNKKDKITKAKDVNGSFKLKNSQ